ncbi:MAG: CDP-alcohol phosphatidyltransferase family protein [Sphingomonadaceae bacterium]
MPNPPGRPPEIEPWSNRLVVHRLSAALLPKAIHSGIAPNVVSVFGLGLGLAAALAYTHWYEPLWATVGFLLMIGWHVMDGLDGALARATGRTSDFGRLVDGIADYTTFVAVNIALALTSPYPWAAMGLAVISGCAHILQSLFYEAGRETYIRRIAGRFDSTPRRDVGGFVERLYNRGERWLGNRTRPFDGMLASAPPAQRAEMLAHWREKAAPRMMMLTPLSANGRTLAIWIACLMGSPIFYWAWEIVALTLLALVGGRWLRQAERDLTAATQAGG